jgi:LCP family protein required for cell wall assembly
MKHQFVQIKPSPSNDSQEQLSPKQNWESEVGLEYNTLAQPQQPISFQHLSGANGKGLLSGWKANHAQTNRYLQTGPQARIQQNVAPQGLSKRPITGPMQQSQPLEQNAAPAGLLRRYITGPISQSRSPEYFQGQVSPHQSAITPLANLYAGAPVQAPPQPQPQLQPQAWRQPQTQELDPKPLPGPSPWNQMPPMQGNYQVMASGMPSMQPPVMPPPVQPSPTSIPKKPGKKKKKSRFPIWARVTVGVFILLLVLIGSGIGYYQVNFASTVSNTIGQTVKRVHGDDAPSNAVNTTSGDILSGNRINILLLGSDTDEKFTDASGVSHYIAQTDIVVTIDPKTQTVGMLSIPRDSWLYAPGYGSPMKLDEAYGYGGAALSEAVIHQDFGIYINYYAWVGLNGFVKVIDTAGGVDVDAIHPITDDNYPDDVGNTTGDIYAYKRLSIAPGPQHMDGPYALEYVRSRHADLVGDFGRSVRQQQILTQLKAKLNNPAIIGKLPELAKDLNGYVKTDMGLTDVVKLMNFARSLDVSKIQRLTLGPPYSGSAQINGKDVVKLNCSKIQPLIAKMFDLGNNSVCNVATNNTTQTSSSTAMGPSSSSTSPATVAAVSPLQLAGQMANLSTANMSGGDSGLMGMRSLLDLMCLVVFESPVGMNV